MQFTKATYIKIIKSILLVGLVFQLFSCRLFVKKCPLPTCEIRKMHRHLLIFSDTPKDKKKPFASLKKEKTDSLSASSDSLSIQDTTTVVKKHKHDEAEEHHATFVEVDGEVLDEEGNVYVDPKEKKRQEKRDKKAAKKKKKEDKKKDKLRAKGQLQEENLNDSELAEEEEDNEYEGMSADEYKKHKLNENQTDTTDVHNFNEKELAKQLKKEDRKAKKQAKKESRLARKGRRGQADYTKLYRSRITKWWRRDQNPKVGKHFKRQTDSVFIKKK